MPRVSGAKSIQLGGVFAMPKQGWKAEFANGVLTVYGATAPNLFHRWMQRLLLGIRWERTNGPS